MTFRTGKCRSSYSEAIEFTKPSFSIALQNHGGRSVGSGVQDSGTSLRQMLAVNHTSSLVSSSAKKNKSAFIARVVT